jgi:hypothetical protein
MTQFISGNFERLQRTYARKRIVIRKITITSWLMHCTVVLCAWHKRSTRPRMMGTFLLPEAGQTSKPGSKCCARERVAWRKLRWRRHRRLLDRVYVRTTCSSFYWARSSFH